MPLLSLLTTKARRADGGVLLRRGLAPPRAEAQRGRWAWLAWPAGVLVLAGLLQVYYICFGPNFHELIPGRAFRSSQLAEPELREACRRFGLKSIINLRGCCPDQDWYRGEARIAGEQGLRQFDVNWSTYMPPGRWEFIKLLEALEKAPEPILIHCRQGADRTSLASAIALLLKTDATLAEARGQMSIRYGHSPIGKVQILDEVLVAYEHWLAEQAAEHSPDRLRHWIREVYLPGPYWAEITPLALPPFLKLGEWTTIPVRVTNRSRHAWQFRQAGHVGFHLGFTVKGPGGKKWASGSAGMFDRDLPPGESLVLNVAIPPLRNVGRCKLFMDMEDERWCVFHMVGSPPLEQEFVVLPWPLPLH